MFCHSTEKLTYILFQNLKELKKIIFTVNQGAEIHVLQGCGAGAGGGAGLFWVICSRSREFATAPAPEPAPAPDQA